jgi:hypothetical protein
LDAHQSDSDSDSDSNNTLEISDADPFEEDTLPITLPSDLYELELLEAEETLPEEPPFFFERQRNPYHYVDVDLDVAVDLHINEQPVYSFERQRNPYYHVYTL